MLVCKYAKLKGRIVEKYENNANFAKKIGMSPQTLSNKLKNIVGLSQEDIVTFGEALDIPYEEYFIYFFT